MSGEKAYNGPIASMNLKDMDYLQMQMTLGALDIRNGRSNRDTRGEMGEIASKLRELDGQAMNHRFWTRRYPELIGF
jgi:hypothetical protein